MLQKVEESVSAGKGNVEGAGTMGGVRKGSEMDLDDASVVRKLIVVVSEKGCGNGSVDGDRGLWRKVLDPEVGGEMDCGKGFVIKERAREGVDEDGSANGWAEGVVDGLEQVAR